MNKKIKGEGKYDNEVEEEKIIKSIKEKLEYLCKRKLSEIMNKNVISVTDETSFIEFANILEKYEYKGVPVVNDKNEIKGMVTWSDMLKLLLFYSSYGQKLIESESFIGIPSVRAMRSSNVITLSPKDTVEEAAHLMSEHNIQTIPIVENDKIVGIIGKKDIIKDISEIINELTKVEDKKKFLKIMKEIINEVIGSKDKKK